MKKIFILICFLFACNLLSAENVVFKIGDSHPQFITDNAHHLKVTIMEIQVISEYLCKVVYSNGITEYFRVNDRITFVSLSDEDDGIVYIYTTVKITDFDYNKLMTEVVSKEKKKIL